MEKVIIIGCPGAGKSTFARALRDLTGLPLIYLDRIWHKADRTTVTRDEFSESLQKVMQGERWIIDGNYLRTIEMRLQHCDTVFFLHYPQEICLQGAAERIGTQREDLPWSEDTLDPEFRQFILDFESEQIPLILGLLDRYKDRISLITFRSREESGEWLRKYRETQIAGEQQKDMHLPGAHRRLGENLSALS